MNQIQEDTPQGSKMGLEEKVYDLAREIAGQVEPLAVGVSKLEKSAFDSINTTDQVMIQLKEAMELLEHVKNQQNKVMSAIEEVAVVDHSEQLEAVLEEVAVQSELLEHLQGNFHGIAEAGVEANDAARAIEYEVAMQGEKVLALNELTSKLIQTIE